MNEEKIKPLSDSLNYTSYAYIYILKNRYPDINDIFWKNQYFLSF